MAKKKNMKADKPEFAGAIVFDGNIQVRIPNHGLKTLRTDLGGMKLQKADPNKELLVLTRNHVGYDEIDTGYIVRAKNYDDGNPPHFGLKHDPDADNWACHNYQDVIAWGYADGGLNDPTLWYSCQSTVEEEIDRERRRAEKGLKTHAERMAEMEAEEEEEKAVRVPDCLTLKFRYKDGQIENETSWPAKEPMPEALQRLMRIGCDNFIMVTSAHPEVKEMHYYTEPTEWEEEETEE